jgi:hypothetical protein
MLWMSQNSLGFGFQNFFPWILPLVILDLVLKGFALWRSSRNNQPIWFIVLLIVNSFGILPLIYLVWADKSYIFKKLQK